SHYSHYSLYHHSCYSFSKIFGDTMKTIIQIHREEKYFVAVDLLTNVADQGLSEEEAVANLKKGLEEHYQILMELAPKDWKVSFLDIEVEKYVQTSRPVS
ncbi:MAG: hypothetical protein ACXQTJ_05230, partial [Candidatus Syntropharchaeales archaeon]